MIVTKGKKCDNTSDLRSSLLTGSDQVPPLWRQGRGDHADAAHGRLRHLAVL